MAQTTSTKTRIISRRAKALAYLRDGGVDPFARRFSAAYRTVALALQKGELGPELAHEFQRELGPDAWRFITGESDTLTDDRQPAEAA